MFEKNVIHQVKKIIGEFPEKNALHVDGSFYTYNELSERVAAMRERLLSEGIKPKDFVAVIVGHDLQSYVSLLAIMSLGAAYVPLNTKNPCTRMAKMVADAGVEIVLFNRESFDDMDALNAALDHKVSVIDTQTLDCSKKSWHVEEIGENDFSYLMFTSGSTGNPKGVPIRHRNLNVFMHHFLSSDRYSFSPSDRFLQMFELTFDLSVVMLFAPLSIGACCYVVPDKGISYINIAKLLRKHKLTVSLMVPSVIIYLERFFKELNLDQLRYSFFCGEALLQPVVTKWAQCLPNGKIINTYGPTEATIACTEYFWEADKSQSEAVRGIVPIGKPMKGAEVYVLDTAGALLSEGEKGELCIGGPQIIDFYWHNEQKTAEAFYTISHEGQKKKVYRTGDICYVNEQGNLIFCGRLDSQVKIDGYRIELGEIESHARDFINQSNLAVLAIQSKLSEIELHLFVENMSQTQEEIKSYLKEKLPTYMCPKHIHNIDQMPLNTNGKTDRKALRVLFGPAQS